MKKILIIGSNFGSKTYLNSLFILKKKFHIYICSPNIFKKNIDKNIVKYQSYKVALLKNKFDYIICATKPNIQFSVVQHLIKNKISIKGILLEKPISQNLIKTKKLVNLLTKNKIIFFVNFIFSELESYKSLKILLKRKKINKIDYFWSFKQAYFLNKISTWKINDREGGGLIKFYGIHAIYHLVDLFNIDSKVKFFIKALKFKKQYITFLNIIFFHKNIKINLILNNNSNKVLHSVKIKNEQGLIHFINKDKDWTKAFNLIVNKKKIKIKKESRIDLTQKTIKKLICNKKMFNKNFFLNYMNNILTAHILCEKIYKMCKIVK